MSPAVECVAWVGGIWLAIAIAAAWTLHRRPQLPQRTPADVYRDVDIHRATRQFAQAIDDYDTCWAICPEASRTARIAETQHRLDKHRKENGT